MTDEKIPQTNPLKVFTAKYIHFLKIADKAKTSVWSVRNKTGDYEIGKVQWNPRWRQYCFSPDANTIFSRGCLDDISKFIRTIMAMRRKDDGA